MQLRAQAEIERRKRSKTGSSDKSAARFYSFRASALDLQVSLHDEIIISGPSETGKTLAALVYIDSLARKYPKSTGAIVRKVRHDMDSTVLKAWRDYVVTPCGDITPFGGEHPEFYDYANGSRIYVGGMDRPGRVLSGALDFCLVNQAEEFNLADWETLGTRTTGRAGKIQPGILIGDCNPAQAQHWIIQRVASGGLKLLESRHIDNPSLYTDDGKLTAQGERTIAKLQKLTGVRKERLYFGRWVNVEGAVYEFDRSIHLIDKMPDGWESWRKFRVIDFGFTNPFTCGWYAVDPDGRLYLYREWYMTQRTVRAHAEVINRYKENYEVTVADHDAEDRATLSECGIHTRAAIKDVSRGIQAMQERLKVADDGKPRFFYLRGALIERDESLVEENKPTCGEQEFDSYMWPKGQDGKPVKEAPIKVDDHAMDRDRYATMYLSYRGSFFK